jgi:predicted transcriptional regulator
MAKARRSVTLDKSVEKQLTKLSEEQGISRSFFANAAIKNRLKRLGLWTEKDD